MILSTQAIVLKTIKYGDSSLICRLFTKDQGKIAIMAKGAWRPKNTSGAILEPMNHILLDYYHKDNRDMQILKNVSLHNSLNMVRSNLSKIILGQIIIESLDKTTPDNNPLPVLYKLTWRVLNKIDEKNVNHWMVFSFFLYHLAVRLGFMPNLESCRNCHAQIQEAHIDLFYGELACNNCVGKNKLIITQKSLHLLHDIKMMHLDEIQNEFSFSNELVSIINFLKIFNSMHLVGMNKVRSFGLLEKILF
tara:strand:- start:72 stop:818 length:747 start_codon:yes stop_codon:yes gene_type:complete